MLKVPAEECILQKFGMESNRKLSDLDYILCSASAFPYKDNEVCLEAQNLFPRLKDCMADIGL